MTVRFPEYSIEIGLPSGAVVLDAVTKAGLMIPTECGGAGRCGKCRVIVHGTVDPPTDIEKRVLDVEALNKGVRLACQAVPRGDVDVRFDCTVINSEISSYREEYKAHGDDHAKSVIRGTEALPVPSVTDQRADLRRLIDGIKAVDKNIPLPVIRDLPSILRESNFNVDVLSDGKRVLNVIPSGNRKALGVALDIGTTTVCARLADLESGKVLTSSIAMNPQRLYGADVATRMSYINDNRKGLERLRNLILDCVEKVIEVMVGRAGVSTEEILKVVVVGNPAMVHIFLGIDPSAIAVAPYISPTSGLLEYGAGKVGLKLAAGAVVEVLPCVAAYIGADAVAVTARTGLHRADKPAAVIDLGTNAEIVLTDGARLFACSAAAGPALEGAHISHGMTAADGAVCRVDIDKDIKIDTIGGCPPAGLCGTGLLDSISESFKMGLISSKGRIADSGAAEIDGGHGSRIFESANMRWIKIYEHDVEGPGKTVAIGQNDVRQFQLAKGAIRAGLDLLLEKAGIGEDSLESIFLAGALGSAIRPESAIRAGLVPDIGNEKIVSIGNAALDGATDALFSADCTRAARELAERMEYMELSAIRDFTDRFVERLDF